MGIMDEERRTSVNLKACIHGGEGSGGVHQHRLPRPHRRRDPHLDGGRPDDPQERDAQHRVDQGLRGPERRYRPGCGLRGRAQIGKGMWAAPDRMADMLAQKIGHPQGRREHRLGPLAHRRDAACAALPRGGRGAAAGGAGEARARAAGGSADHPGGRPAELVARRCRSRSWTTTARASWATSCAGSTRASAARRCRTSTTSG